MQKKKKKNITGRHLVVTPSSSPVSNRVRLRPRTYLAAPKSLEGSNNSEKCTFVRWDSTLVVGPKIRTFTRANRKGCWNKKGFKGLKGILMGVLVCFSDVFQYLMASTASLCEFCCNWLPPSETIPVETPRNLQMFLTQLQKECLAMITPPRWRSLEEWIYGS